MKRRPFPHTSSGGFTLLELLTTLVIIAIIISLVMGSTGVTRNNEITTGSTTVMEQLSLAHELAVSGNHPTEVWFLRKTGGTMIEAIQIYRINEDGVAQPSTKAEFLPKGIGIDTGTFLSPIMASANAKTWTDPTTKPVLTGFGKNYDCWQIRFLADGSVSLAASQQWFMTLHLLSLGDKLAALPPNYAVISISPMSGKISLYRP